MRCFVRISILGSCLALFASGAAVSACTTKTCTLVGCQNQLAITYGEPVAGPYSLTLSSAGASGTIACPSDYALLDADAGAATINFVTVSCTSTGFDLGWVFDKPLGTTPPDAPEIVVQATVTPKGTNSALHGTVSLKNPTKSEPNGAACGPTCYSRSGTLTLAH